MTKLKTEIVFALVLSLAIGFAGGFASKYYLDKQNETKKSDTAISVPVQKMKEEPILSNQLIAPHLWSIYLDPIFVPEKLGIPPLALPDFVGTPINFPDIKTIDGKHELQVVVKVPGMTEKEVDIEAGADTITIKGHHKEESDTKNHFAMVDESFVRTIQLPCKVDSSKAKASLKNGVLTVSLPKVEDRKN